MDRLIDQLEKSNSGCWIGNKYGVLIYADDIVLIAPSVTGLQNMVNVCAKFGKDNSINFNQKKSLCMCVGMDTTEDLVITLDSKTLDWSPAPTQVGNVISNTMCDTYDIGEKKLTFFQQTNMVLADFRGMRHDILCQLFNKYCNSFYGSQCWDLRSEALMGLYTGWNKAVRRLLRLPYNSHKFLLPSLLNVQSLEVQFIKRFCKMFSTMFNSKNGHMRFLAKHSLHNGCSLISRNMFFITDKYGVSRQDIVKCNLNKIHDLYSQDQERVISQVRELLEIRDSQQILNGFTLNEIQDIIDFISCA